MAKKQLIKRFKQGNYQPHRIVNPYTAFAEHYDDVMIYLNYNLWAKYILNTVNFFNIKKNSLLEIASGTGILANLLNKFIPVTPTDYSDYMLQVLTNRYPHLSPIKMDMRNFTLDNQFDIIISFNDNVNYLKHQDEIFSHFQCAKNHLAEGGLFLFDCTPVFNIQKNFIGKPLFIKSGNKIIRWSTLLKDNSGTVEAIIDIFDIETGEILREIHLQTIHNNENLVELLKTAGFSKIYIFDGFTLNPPHNRSEHYHIAALT